MSTATVGLPAATLTVTSKKQQEFMLFLASFVALYFELVLIRYLSTEIRTFAYLVNVSLVAAFAGIGLGMTLEGPPKKLLRLFPVLASVLVLVIANADRLHLTHLPFPTWDYLVWGTVSRTGFFIPLLTYWGWTFSILVAVLVFFITLGGLVGQTFAGHESLRGYAINLAGSFGGILTFTVISYLGLSPAVWILIGTIAALPFFRHSYLTIGLFAFTIIAVGLAQKNAYWSPYYKITLEPLKPPTGSSTSSALLLSVNHDYHQKLIDLSPKFLSQYPDAEPNRSAKLTYELPYMLVPHPKNVLVIGAGTGNDVAAALRHGTQHLDAIEIDRTIYELGVMYHPEHPYSSEKVTVFINDARAFLKSSKSKYDLIVFAYLDAHTMLTNFSSVRLDNYVYTVESFREARSLLSNGGSLVLAFASGQTFISGRMFGALNQAFGMPPRAFNTQYDGTGIVFVEGAARDLPLPGVPDITEQLASESKTALVQTDDWPFLYLRNRSVPVSILMIILPFVVLCAYGFDLAFRFERFRDLTYLQLFLLGVGFLLLETSGVTRLSLAFGSTWVVNAIVIAAFLIMSFIANVFVQIRIGSYSLGYLGLFLTLVVNIFLPIGKIEALPMLPKILCAILIIASPVFFSGIVFSQTLRTHHDTARALGINLMGAVVGGVLENLSMVGGVGLLIWLALLIYGLSALSLVGRARTVPAVI